MTLRLYFLSEADLNTEKMMENIEVTEVNVNRVGPMPRSLLNTDLELGVS